MNFHLELLKSGYRKELKRRTGRSLDILEVRRHELVIGRSPTWAPCRIRYLSLIHISDAETSRSLWAACTDKAPPTIL